MKDLLTEAGFNTILGIGTVFIMLIIMALIIYCFRIIPIIQNKFAKKTEEPQTLDADNYMAEPVFVADETDDLELAAVIAAAIAASEQAPVDSFRVRTIKRRR